MMWIWTYGTQNGVKSTPKKEPGATCETVKYWLPRGFPPLHELPPSLRPPLPRDEKVETALEWGV